MSESSHLNQDENQLIQLRRQKLSEWRQTEQAYPNDFKKTHDAIELHTLYGGLSKAELEEKNINVAIAGRMKLKRIMGKASFATLQDGQKSIQLYIAQNQIGAASYEIFKHWDLGDIIAASGTIMKTNKGELSVACDSVRLLSKSLRPLPEKFHGLTDTEQKYRERHLDLMSNEETRQTFLLRSQIINCFRQTMNDRHFLEVETPMMHPIPGGAQARPFVTHHNALNRDLYLRIAPELYLKRLIVGGFNRVFEINRNFRNEGLSTRHNPEFTMMEFYEAYSHDQKLMDDTESLLKKVVLSTLDHLKVRYQDTDINFEKPFERLTIEQAIQKQLNASEAQVKSQSWLINQLPDNLANTDATVGYLQMLVFEEHCEENLWQPTFITHYPVDVSPLARSRPDNPNVTERFELFIAGREIANGFSELNDPEDQAERFKKQALAKEQGDKEAMHYDADFVKALEYGMPPTGGCGIGIDRFVMLLTNSLAIRDVILFPQMRPNVSEK